MSDVDGSSQTGGWETAPWENETSKEGLDAANNIVSIRCDGRRQINSLMKISSFCLTGRITPTVNEAYVSSTAADIAVFGVGHAAEGSTCVQLYFVSQGFPETCQSCPEDLDLSSFESTCNIHHHFASILLWRLCFHYETEHEPKEPSKGRF